MEPGCVRLTDNMRIARLVAEGQSATEQQDFERWLLSIGDGTIGSKVLIPLCVLGILTINCLKVEACNLWQRCESQVIQRTHCSHPFSRHQWTLGRPPLRKIVSYMGAPKHWTFIQNGFPISSSAPIVVSIEPSSGRFEQACVIVLPGNCS